ncbi:hypothetical protein BOTBODRAFT_30466 [Botryobasidium botryosum FD-172 SS1]|uniref:Peptidase S8/S53 domain-containing protein n=1 Tax=Botryobasidium botryosum (strain FD-172 SS1) TaxID=930990 RepID=A0A067MNF2_BOTB1|nr:hypothetical protein BOTBODRAFT_30466 [Botryobasidium botryosum FD-172 SS1]
MQTFIFAAALFSLVCPAISAPTTIVPISPTMGEVKPNSYIVKIKDDADKSTHISQLTRLLDRSNSFISYDYVTTLKGYAGTLRGEALSFIQSSNDVELIEPDHIVGINFSTSTPDMRRDHEVLARTDLDSDESSNGAGVDVYAIDTGVYVGHTCFDGRAKWGATFGGYANKDGNGHGTHTAATAAGSKYGVAPSASIIAVKVLSDSGQGPTSDVIAGVDWAIKAALISNRPSVVTMSLGGPASNALDSSVKKGIANGIHFTLAAGNDNKDAANSSPAHVAVANTIGAVDSRNVKARFSNYGAVVDVFAPGVNILSAWIGSPTASRSISGTSMATPYVAGILAATIGDYGNDSPASVSAALKSHGKRVVTGVSPPTTNMLAVRW